MKIFGLVGFPVEHSYSAIMHNAVFKELGIDARYDLFEIKPFNFNQEFKALLDRGVSGLNVTIPFKEKVVKLVNSVEPQAELIGAVNTIKINADKTATGYNTDGAGFGMHLNDIVGFSVQGRQVSILGAGGAAKAICVQLAKTEVAGISIFDVAQDKAKKLKLKLTSNFPNCPVQVVKTADALLEHKPDLLVNATPLGMHKGSESAFNAELLHKKLVVYDLVYNPKETPLIKQAKRKGCVGVFNGLGMLLYQGVLAFKIWLDTEPPIDVTEAAKRGKSLLSLEIPSGRLFFSSTISASFFYIYINQLNISSPQTIEIKAAKDKNGP